MADSATLRYLDNLGNVQKKTFEVLHVWGLDMPGKFKYIPPEAFYKIVDGSSRTDYRAWQRIIQVELGVINADEDYLQAYFKSIASSFAYQGSNIIAEEVQVVSEISVEDTWLEDFKFTKIFNFEILENVARTVWPTSPSRPKENMIGYIIHNVKVEGTQSAPETFTTNVGKLLYNYGTTPFDSISLLSFIPIITCNSSPKQDAKCNQVGDITQSGSNITFQLAVSDGGNPSPDGFYYFDILIALQEIGGQHFLRID